MLLSLFKKHSLAIGSAALKLFSSILDRWAAVLHMPFPGRIITTRDLPYFEPQPILLESTASVACTYSYAQSLICFGFLSLVNFFISDCMVEVYKMMERLFLPPHIRTWKLLRFVVMTDKREYSPWQLISLGNFLGQRVMATNWNVCKKWIPQIRLD